MSDFRHCCEKDGCYVKRYKAPIEDFDDDLPRTCQYTDVDGMVECEGHFLFAEFKRSVGAQMQKHWDSGSARVVDGQILALERLSINLPKSTVWLIEGNSPERQIVRMRELILGIWGEWEDIDWSGLKTRHANWLRDSKLREERRVKQSHDVGARGRFLEVLAGSFR